MTKQDTADHILDSNEIFHKFIKKSLIQLAVQKKKKSFHDVNIVNLSTSPFFLSVLSVSM